MLCDCGPKMAQFMFENESCKGEVLCKFAENCGEGFGLCKSFKMKMCLQFASV